ncbi:Low temperature viability protein [Aulographum hederae CBS 113979]|uniref:Low temperature viability protein n=1 Tax=Aulographum hederae CBS 113979 TaxID=1176131 RepID=A0A6G1GYS8_9PEZI|nr:Low temperature viability protein [Aulographum hederae CBS 113979]
MPRLKTFDKKTATRFTLVHRAQNDPLYHDDTASPVVFKEVDLPNTTKPATESSSSYPQSSSASVASGRSRSKHLQDLASEFGDVRGNEGEAAQHGIYLDDTKYDYMQHLRDIDGSGVFVPAESEGGGKKGKSKAKQQSLEDAIRNSTYGSNDAASLTSGMSGMSLNSENAVSLLGEDALGSEYVRPTTYQEMQDIPDSIGGFQPDMDPRLREVLEALEDEAYVDEEENFWEGLKGDGREVEQYDWEDGFIEGEGDGWESDDTIKPIHEFKDQTGDGIQPPIPDIEGREDHGDGDWMAEFSKFKKDVKAAKGPQARAAFPSGAQSSIMTGASNLTSGRRKKRKGALTATSGTSMSSASLARTDALSTLDSRFDKIEEAYAADNDESSSQFDDNASLVSGASRMSAFSQMSGASKMSQFSHMSGFTNAESDAPKTLRSDFDSIMDGFLGTHSMASKTRVKRVKPQSGLEQLDEMRKDLGPARVKSKARKV